jgi:DNA-binding NarL/FixJ family response regulator
VEVFDRRVNAELVVRTGHHPLDSPLIHEVLLDNKLTDYEGLFTSVGAGETILWVLHETPGGSRFGEHSADVFRMLLPSFKAGLETLDRLHAHRAALDVVDTPLAVFDLGGREIFRNGPLTRLLAAAPDSDALQDVIRQAVADGRLRDAPSRHIPIAVSSTPVTRTVRTPTACYDVRATVVEPGIFHAGESVVVLVQEQARPPRLDSPIIRERFDLTRREAEIAALIADGLSNSEIADRLFISVHTVKRHVEKILDKLAVPSRAAVHAKLLEASWAGSP